MKKLLIISVLLAFASGYAFGQGSSATPIVAGYYTTTGNGWLPFTAANPLPLGSN